MSPYNFILVSTLVFTFVAALHAVRAWWNWPVQIGPISVSINMSWVAFAVSGLLAIWGFANL
jgi:hypothetical protein